MAKGERTATFVSSSDSPSTPGLLVGPHGRWQFSYQIDQTPLVSSQRKLIYQGTFAGASQQTPIAACALAFEAGEVEAFGIECVNLSHLSDLGVGPKLLAVTDHCFETLDGKRPVIIEEDVGESLADLLGSSAECVQDPIIHAPGTPERRLENQKILYDVFVQLQASHNANIYHRDLRCENVCVRRFGTNPADIRATIIDFDLGASQDSSTPHARASLYQTLFCAVPTYLAGRQVALKPNSLELDMAYLAALQYHVERDGLPLNDASCADDVLDDFSRYITEHVAYFAYRDGKPPYARRIDTLLDIDDLAISLGLTPVREEAFATPQLLELARSFHKPYLDGKDLESCLKGPEARLASMVDDIVAAKFETYKALRRSQGEEVEYERYDDQPISLQRSNYAQAEHIPTKVRALGYLIVAEYDPKAYEEVTALSGEQIEALARLEHDRWIDERISAGWTLGPDRDPIKLTSPYLIAYDELPERTKECDRDVARQLIGLVRSAGLAVVRPK